MKNLTKVIVICFFVIVACFFTVNSVSTNNSNFDLSSYSLLNNANAERYLGDSWGEGYSWSVQYQESSVTLSVSGTAGMSFSGSGSISVSGGVSSSWDAISCCNPSNQYSDCNFETNDNNCIRY